MCRAIWDLIKKKQKQKNKPWGPALQSILLEGTSIIIEFRGSTTLKKNEDVFLKKICDSLINFFFDIKSWNLPIVLIGFIHWNDFAKIEHNSFSWRFRFGQSKRSFCLFRLQVQKPASNKYIKLTWLLLGLPHQI